MSIDARVRNDLLAFERDFLDHSCLNSPAAVELVSMRLEKVRDLVGRAVQAGALSKSTLQLAASIVGKTSIVAGALADSKAQGITNDLRAALADAGATPQSSYRSTPSDFFSKPATPQRSSHHVQSGHRDEFSTGREARGQLLREEEDITECKAWCEKNWRHLYPDATAIRALALACNAPVARIQTWFSAYRKNSGFNALDAHFQAKGIDLRTADVGHDPRLSRADEAKIACYRGKLSAGGERDFIASTLASVNLSSDEEDSGRSSRSSGSRGHSVRRDAVPLPSRSKPTADPQGNRRLSLAPAPDRASFSFYPPAHLTRTTGDRSSGQPSPTSSTPSPTSSEYGWSGSDSAYSTDATAASIYDERLSQSRRCPSPSYGRSPSSPSLPAGRRSSFSGPAGGLLDQTSRSPYGHPQPPSPQSSRMSSMGSRGPPPASARGYGGR